MTGIIVDIIIVALIILSTFFGYKKGLTGVILKIFSFLIAVVLMLVLYKPVSNFVIKNTTIDENIKAGVTEQLKKLDINKESTTKEENKEKESFVTEYINKYVNEAIEQGKEDVIEYVSDKLSIAIINVIMALIVFIVSMTVLLIISLFLKLLVKLPILRQIDKSGGIIYGILRAIIVIYVILAILSVMSAMIEDFSIIKAIEDSTIGNMMYNNNLILKMIVK